MNVKHSSPTVVAAVTLFTALAFMTTGAQSADPLPSWNEGRTKRSITDFVARVTTKGSPDFVPPAERIATFDNDGALWTEQPVIQGAFLMYQLNKMAQKDPTIRQRQPFKAAFEHDTDYLKEEGLPAILELFAATHGGMSQDEFEADVKEFFATAQHPTLKRPFRELAYRPMVELLQYLRANGFKTYICSGGGIDFMRVFSAELYGIPPEQVIGSSQKKTLQQRDRQWAFARTGTLNSFNDKEMKPVNIDLHVGRAPLLAPGNERSGGDIAMLRYSQSRKGPSLQLLVDHNDAGREFSYDEPDDASLNAAKENGWTVVDMKADWKVIHSSQR
jgi:phosphoglycolate phosphatase-like HAD superfamily hydrolase